MVFKKGHEPYKYWLGKHRDMKTRLKISKANMGHKSCQNGMTYEQYYGKKRAQEIRKKLSISQKGRLAWNKGLTIKTDIRVRKNIKNTSKTLRKKYANGELIIWNKNKSWENLLGRNRAKEMIKSIKKSLGIYFKTPIGQKHLRNWMITRKPTFYERCFRDYYIDLYNLDFIYTGNGKKWFGNKNPDFWNSDGIVVEIQDPWHHLVKYGIKDTPYNRQLHDAKYIRHYAKFGIKCICLWDNRLKDENYVLRKMGVIL